MVHSNSMLKINFSPETDRKEFVEAADVYAEIWAKEGVRIVDKLQELTGLDFKKDSIDAVTFEGISRAGVHTPPMKLRSSYPEDVKLAALIHELAHYLLHDNKLDVNLDAEGQELENHRRINLFLYDAWADLFSKEFADKQVKVESCRTPFYKQAWDWALGLSREARQKKFEQLKNQQK